MSALVPRIDDAGLPNRGGALIHREESLYPAMVLRLEGRGRAATDGAVDRLSMELVLGGLEGDDTQPLIAASFLAGRCEPLDATDGASLDAALRSVVAGLDVNRLLAEAPAFVEASMSIGLRGDTATASGLLVQVASDGGVGSTHDFLAAYYLAQYGDPAGWRAMRRALGSNDDHTRLMAVRHLIAFVPFDGTSVDDDTIDVRRELLEHVDDVTMIATEIPSLLAEAGVDELDAILSDLAANAESGDVRTAAARVQELLAAD